MWVPLQWLSRSEPLMRMGEHASRVSVSLYWLSSSELLTRIYGHSSSMWVSPLIIRLTDENEHASSLWVLLQWLVDQNHWQEWVDMHLACESLSSDADQNHWWESASSLWVPLQCWLELIIVNNEWTSIQAVSPSLVIVIRTTDKIEHPFRLWVCLQYWANWNHW